MAPRASPPGPSAVSTADITATSGKTVDCIVSHSRAEPQTIQPTTSPQRTASLSTRCQASGASWSRKRVRARPVRAWASRGSEGRGCFRGDLQATGVATVPQRDPVCLGDMGRRLSPPSRAIRVLGLWVGSGLFFPTGIGAAHAPCSSLSRLSSCTGHSAVLAFWRLPGEVALQTLLHIRAQCPSPRAQASGVAGWQGSESSLALQSWAHTR